MPVALTELPSRHLSSDPPRKRWTRDECSIIEVAGVLDQQHLELVEGELITKMGKKRPHVNTLALIHGWLVEVFGQRFVNSEAPIDVAPEDNPTNEPEPDLIVLNRDLSHFVSTNPRPEDLLLIVEISDTTLGFDMTTKAALYARAGLVEYWVVDVAGRRVIIHRNPTAAKYMSIVAYWKGERVATLAIPSEEVAVADLFVD